MNTTNKTPMIARRLVVPGLVAGAVFVSFEQRTFAAIPATDPAHAAHAAAATPPAASADPAISDPAVAKRFSQLQAKVAQLEATLAKNAPPSPSAAAGSAMPGMSPTAAPAPAMAGMGGGAAEPAGEKGMMGMMDKMMGMMDEMMGMKKGAPMPSGGMETKDKGDKMEMGGMVAGSMPAAPASAGMSGGGMGMDKMGMAGMMGMSAGGMGGSPSAGAQSALPGYAGASHLYHIGATGFFLDHPEHLTLTTEQQVALNRAKEQALMSKSAAEASVKQAEQALWTLTASDQPDVTQIEAKIHEIEKTEGDERLSFIRAVGDASKILTEDQRKALTGFAPSTVTSSMPAMPPSAAAAMPAGGMKDM